MPFDDKPIKSTLRISYYPSSSPNLPNIPHYEIGIPTLHFKKSGPRVLLVVQHPEKDDMAQSQPVVFSGTQGVVLGNTVNFAIDEGGAVPASVMVLNYENANMAKVRGQARHVLYTAFKDRFFRVIDDYHPDIVVFFGAELPSWYFGMGRAKEFYQERCGRIFEETTATPQGPRKIRFMVTLPVEGFAPTTFDDFWRAPLAGAVAHHLIDAFLNRNRHDLSDLTTGARMVWIKTIQEFDAFMEDLWQCPTPAFDTESRGLMRINNTVLTLQCSIRPKEAYFLPLDHTESPWTREERAHIIDSLRYYFENTKCRYHIFHNATFDIRVIREFFSLRFYAANLWDTMAGEFTLDENRKFLKILGFGGYSLASLEHKYGFVRPEEEMGKDDRKDMASKPLATIFRYACWDTISLLGIHECQRKEGQLRGPDYENMEYCVTRTISDTLHVIAVMESRGHKADRSHLIRLTAKDSPFITEQVRILEELQKSEAAHVANGIIHKKQGTPENTLFGTNEQPWVLDWNKDDGKRALFFDALGLDPLETRKDGFGSINAKFKKYYSHIPEVSLLEQYEKVKKLKSAFVDALLKKLADSEDARDGRIRCSYGFTGVLTGRLSSWDPNMQQIPTRDSFGTGLPKAIKRIFVAGWGSIYLKADFSAHEIRGWGVVSRDPAIIAAFKKAAMIRRHYRLARTKEDIAKWLAVLKKEGDIHIINVKTFFGIDIEKKHPLRQGIKFAVFGAIYGISIAALSDQIFGLDYHGKLHREQKALLKERAQLMRKLKQQAA